MTRKLLLIGTAVGFCLAAVDLAAQEPGSAIKPGDRIRVYRVAEPDGRVTGTFVGRDATDLQVVSDIAKTQISIPLAEVTKLERSAGTHGHTLAGMGVGAGIGLGLGLVAAGGDNSSWVEIGAGEVVLGTAVFAAAGALVGTLVRSESWVEVPLATIELPPAPPTDTTAPIVAPIAEGH